MPSLQEVTGQDESEITKVETPSGLEIAFRAEPRQYWVNEIPVPGVTTILGILGNEALPWWGMTVGVEGVQTLAGMSALKDDETMDWLVLSSVDEIVKRLTAEKLTVNHNLGKSADRGTSVHLGLERWCETGVLPDPEKWPEEERGYIRGLIGFLEAVQPRPIHRRTRKKYVPRLARRGKSLPAGEFGISSPERATRTKPFTPRTCFRCRATESAWRSPTTFAPTTRPLYRSGKAGAGTSK
jgi:hypothetical protein